MNNITKGSYEIKNEYLQIESNPQWLMRFLNLNLHDFKKHYYLMVVFQKVESARFE